MAKKESRSDAFFRDLRERLTKANLARETEMRQRRRRLTVWSWIIVGFLCVAASLWLAWELFLH